MEPKRVVSLPHPIVDESGPGWVSSRSTAPVVALTSGREALFVDAARAGVRVVLITEPTARLTFAMHQLLSVLSGVWLTREHDGTLRHAVGGEPVASLAGVTEPGYTPTVTVPTAELLATLDARVGSDALQPWLQFTVAVHHPPRAETSLGGVTQTLVEAVTGGLPAAWGTSEPVTIPWDRARITSLARARMPRDSRVYVNGTAGGIRYSGSLRSFRSEIGVTEETRVVFALDDASATTIDRAADLCESLAEREQVLMATAWGMRGAADAAILPYWPTTPQPLAAVVGARAVRSMALDTAEFEAHHHARITGNRRTPSIVVDFGADDVRLQRFARAFDAIGAEALTNALIPPAVRNAS